MPSAEKTPTPNEVRKAIVRKFEEEYAGPLEDSRVSAEHTATHGWQNLYQRHRKMRASTITTMGKQLRELADTLEAFGWTEDNEKSVKDLAKQSAELRAADAIFEQRFISRIVEPVRACERIIERYSGEARREEESNPLIAKGTIGIMAEAIESCDKPSWDDATGVVTISKGK